MSSAFSEEWRLDLEIDEGLNRRASSKLPQKTRSGPTVFHLLLTSFNLVRGSLFFEASVPGPIHFYKHRHRSSVLLESRPFLPYVFILLPPGIVDSGSWRWLEVGALWR